MAKTMSLMEAGVTIYKPETCTIDLDVEVGPDTILEPFVQLLGKTKVGSDCRIRSGSIIENSVIEDGALIQNGTIMHDSVVRVKAIVGPYSHLRPGSDIGPGAHLGNFVETKKTKLGKGSKANHLTYLGDSIIGEGVNIGAGTITCNYDGTGKYPTIIEDGVFVGSDSTLVAPVKLGRGSYIAAASCVTDEVPADALAIGRGRQINKEGWAKERRERLAGAKKA
jgi:bifunctional UDP-N-acetylglucosamine pyrophosphorylase/glucosamine-1-phosphate N-acetyltransferase